MMHPMVSTKRLASKHVVDRHRTGIKAQTEHTVKIVFIVVVVVGESTLDMYVRDKLYQGNEKE